MVAMELRWAGLVVATWVTASALAMAEEPRGWQAEITPMAWIAGIEGTVTVDGQKTEFEKSASDLFDFVEFAGGLTGTVQYNRWVLRGQFDYFGMSTDALDVEDRPQGGSLETDMVLTELGAGYQFNGWQEGQTFDLQIGLRSLHTENDLEVYGDGGGSHSKDSDLLDPLLALRGSVAILPSKIKGLWFNAFAAIGGGGDSQLVYELQPQLQYRISKMFAARLGYRRVGWQVDSDQNQDELDFTLAGLILGLGVTF